LSCTEILPDSNEISKDFDSDNEPLFANRGPPVAEASCKVATDKEIYNGFAKTKDGPEIWQQYSNPSGYIFSYNSGMSNQFLCSWSEILIVGGKLCTSNCHTMTVLNMF
jgi:hypothetical protein